MRDRNGGAELNQSRWWAGDVHEMSGLRDFLGAGQRCSSRCAVAGAGVKRTVVWWFKGAGFVVRGFTESSGRCGWECGVECRRGGYSRYEFSAPWTMVGTAADYTTTDSDADAFRQRRNREL